MTITAGRLPTDSLAALIRVAIKDARGLDRTIYYPRYDRWHCPNGRTPQCSVCLAGAVVAGTLKAPATTALGGEYLEIDPYTAGEEKALVALDHVRLGEWAIAYNMLEQFHRAAKVEDYVDDAPCRSQFLTWSQFLDHLWSLEFFVEKLEKFEDEVPANQR